MFSMVGETRATETHETIFGTCKLRTEKGPALAKNHAHDLYNVMQQCWPLNHFAALENHLTHFCSLYIWCDVSPALHPILLLLAWKSTLRGHKNYQIHQMSWQSGKQLIRYLYLDLTDGQRTRYFRQIVLIIPFPWYHMPDRKPLWLINYSHECLGPCVDIEALSVIYVLVLALTWTKSTLCTACTASCKPSLEIPRNCPIPVTCDKVAKTGFKY